MRKIISPLFAPLLCAACVLAAAGSAVAADPAGDAASTHAAKRTEFRQRHFDQLDANHDGVVSRVEYQAWVDARFDKLDGNHDGQVDANEVANAPATAERVQKRAEGFVKRNGNGKSTVSKTDFEAKAMARFDRLGAGADTLTIDQLTAGRHGFGHRHGAATPDAAPGCGRGVPLSARERAQHQLPSGFRCSRRRPVGLVILPLALPRDKNEGVSLTFATLNRA